ncbi:DUF3997 domain-containing protein [Clostridium culturomicium]|uniref:DUF3997 domain-containing protein n=1 Tax=Clostridium culturomicium TaxID=1499683 RepID=UPI00058E0CE6|nr:DUF3997 domain-containing protein [Clostridium culturomicium]
MKKGILIICVLLFVIFSLTGCTDSKKVPYVGPGSSDYYYMIGEHYQIWRASNNSITLDKVEEGQSAWAIIREKVTKVGWDDSFILAEQTPLIKETMTLDEENICYWIISIGNGELYGPLTEEEFDSKRIELNVDTEITLKSPESYKYLMEEQGKSKLN